MKGAFENTPSGTLAHAQANGHPIRVLVTDSVTGKVIVDHTSKSGVLVTIEKLRLEEYGSLIGEQGIFHWGNPVGWYYGVERLQEHLLDPAIRRAIGDALVKMGLTFDEAHVAIGEMAEQIADRPRPEMLRDGITIVDRHPRLRLDGKDSFMVYGYGIEAEVFDDDYRYVCPNLKGLEPGSGKLDIFLLAMLKHPKLDKPLVFRNFTNARLRRHLERMGMACED